MSRKKKPAEPSTPPASGGTAPVRIEADLARMASIIATVSGQDVSAILSPMLREPLTARYAEVVRQHSDSLPEEGE